MNMEQLKAKLAQLEADPNDVKQETIEVEDLAKQKEKEFLDKFYSKVNDALRKFSGDFFIVRHIFRQKLSQEPQDEILTRQTCESPTWQQSQWIYVRKLDAWDLLWTLPDRETHMIYRSNPLMLETEVQKRLYNDILRFESGELDVICNRYNLIYNRPAKDQKKLIIAES